MDHRKTFSQRFNQELSQLGFPEDVTEKKNAVHVVFGVTRSMANAMIFGHTLPTNEQMYEIAKILEVCPQWLSGASDRKKAFSGKETSEKA
jgi:hypothetical protein